MELSLKDGYRIESGHFRDEHGHYRPSLRISGLVGKASEKANAALLQALIERVLLDRSELGEWTPSTPCLVSVQGNNNLLVQWPMEHRKTADSIRKICDHVAIWAR